MKKRLYRLILCVCLVAALLSGIGVLVLAIRDLRARKQGRHSGKRERRSET